MLRYNHSQDYVNLVLRIMEAYSSGDYTAVPSGTYGGASYSSSASSYSTAINKAHKQAKVRHAKQKYAAAHGGSLAGYGGPGSTGSGSGSGSGGSGGGTGGTGVNVPGTGGGSGGGSGGDPVTKVVKGVTGTVGGVVGGVTGGGGGGNNSPAPSDPDPGGRSPPASGAATAEWLAGDGSPVAPRAVRPAAASCLAVVRRHCGRCCSTARGALGNKPACDTCHQRLTCKTQHRTPGHRPGVLSFR